MELVDACMETIAGKPVSDPEGADERFMLRALRLAERGRGTTSPNPMVGAVIVGDGPIIAEGWHERAGGLHAEAMALAQAGEEASGATVYVTLEPCAHHGRTPACVDALKAAGVSRVVLAMRDPNPDVKGGGWEALSSAGIEVVEGPYRQLAERQNEAYIKRVTTGLPFLTLKMAMSLDGRVATNTGISRWISGEESRAEVHRMRAQSDAVMVGIGTVLRDDPELRARTGHEVDRQPLRVVVDWEARTPLSSKLADVSVAPTLIAISDRAPEKAVAALRSRGVEVLRAGEGGRVDLRGLLKELSDREVTTVQCEGGPGLAAMLMQAGLVDKLAIFVAPMVISGRDAPGLIGGEGIEEIAGAARVRIDSVTAFGEDIRVVAYTATD